MKAYAATQLGKKWPLIINGKKISDREYIPSVNPAQASPDRRLLGHARRSPTPRPPSPPRQAAFPRWRATPVEDRAKILERAADLMEARRFELNALSILEAGKPWIEADGDISEAIDFCRYYAVEMRKLAQPGRHASPCPANVACKRGRRAASASPSPRGISRSRSSPA